MELEELMEMDLLVGGATLLLAAGTFWLARETRQMARSTKEMVDLEAQPHLALADLAISFESPKSIAPAISAQISLKLWNPGKVLVKYRVEHMTVSINKNVPPAGAKLSNRGGVIHPGGGTTYFYPAVVMNPPAGGGPVTGIVKYTFIYWSVQGEEHKLSAELDVTVSLPPNPGCPWVYVDGPHYS